MHLKKNIDDMLIWPHFYNETINKASLTKTLLEIGLNVLIVSVKRCELNL